MKLPELADGVSSGVDEVPFWVRLTAHIGFVTLRAQCWFFAAMVTAGVV
jgi:hypothetical protein